MEPTEFYQGMKTDEEANTEFVAGAEHFVRLKKQVGLQPSQVEEPLEKEAEYGDSWGDHAGGNADWRRTFFNKSPVLRMPNGEVKTSSLTQAMKKLGFDIKGIAKNPQVLGAMIGAGLGAGNVFMKSRPKSHLGGRSSAEFEAEAQVAARQGQPETGFVEKLRNRMGELQHGVAKTFREHPAKGSLLGAGVGAMGGVSLVRALGGKK